MSGRGRRPINGCCSLMPRAKPRMPRSLPWPPLPTLMEVVLLSSAQRRTADPSPGSLDCSSCPASAAVSYHNRLSCQQASTGVLEMPGFDRSLCCSVAVAVPWVSRTIGPSGNQASKRNVSRAAILTYGMCCCCPCRHRMFHCILRMIPRCGTNASGPVDTRPVSTMGWTLVHDQSFSTFTLLSKLHACLLHAIHADSLSWLLHQPAGHQSSPVRTLGRSTDSQLLAISACHAAVLLT